MRNFDGRKVLSAVLLLMMALTVCFAAPAESADPQVYQVEVVTAGHGTAAADPVSGAAGTVVTLTATPDQGYRFKDWRVVTGGVTITDSKFSIGHENVIVAAFFEPVGTPEADQRYNIHIMAFGEGAAWGNPTIGPTGTVVSLYQQANMYFHFSAWYDVYNNQLFYENTYTIGTSDALIYGLFAMDDNQPDTEVTVSGAHYQLDNTNLTASFDGMKKKNNKKLTIPPTVEANGMTYRVTEITANACKKNSKLQQLTIGANVETIGAGAFSGCSSLTKVTIKTTKLTKAGIGKNCFKGTGDGVTYKLPKKMKKNYKKWLTKIGKASKSATYK